MGFRHITLIAGMLFASHAMAIAITPINANIPQVECDGKSTSFQSNLHDLQAMDLSQLIHKAAVEEDDTRVGLNDFKPKVLRPVQKDEGKLVQKIVGRCGCSFVAEGQTAPQSIYSSCFVAGNRQTNTEVHFNAHLMRPFFTPDGVQKPGKLSCNYSNKFGHKPIEFTLVPGSFRFGSLKPGDIVNDRGVAKLSQQIPGAVELPVLDGGNVVHEGMSLYLFSAEQDRMKVRVDSRQPIAQEVKVLSVIRDSSGKVRAFTTSGSATKHSSGSVYATRDAQGGLAAVAILQSTSPEGEDGKPMFTKDSKTGKTLISNGIVAIPMQPEFSADDLQMAEGAGGRSGLPAATKGL